MKRLTSFFICIIIALSIPFTAFAAPDNSFEKPDDLLQYWEENGYPDYVCGVWSNDGTQNNITISVLNNEEGEKGKEEILSSVIANSSIKFEYGKYPRNELAGIQEELYSKYEKYNIDSMIFTTSLCEKENCVKLGLDLKNKTDEIEGLISYCEKQYGDKVVIVQGDIGYDADLYDSLPVDYNSISANNNNFIMFGFAVIVLGAVLFVVLYTRKSSPDKAMLTTSGNTVTAGIVTTSQVEKMIKESEKTPSADFDKKMYSLFKS